MSEDESSHHTNDKLFRAGFSEPATAAAFLRHELPAPIAGRVDWESMKLVPGSFIDSHFRKSETDLLFTAPVTSTPCYFYLLFEHQTKQDPWMGLRLLRYMVRIWEHHSKAHPREKKLPAVLPAVLPIVLAQNATRWELDTRFTRLLDIPADLAEAFAPYVPDFGYQLLQLADMPFEAIQGTPAGILILRVLKAEQLDDLLAKAVWDGSLINQLPLPIFELILRYMLGRDIDRTGFVSRVQEISNLQTRSQAMTLAQQFRQEGRQEGRQQGREEGQVLSMQRAVLEALEVRFDQVPEGLREAVEALMDEAKLTTLLRAAIKSGSLEEFASQL